MPALLLLIQTPAPGCNTHGRLYIAGFRDVANELGLRTTSIGPALTSRKKAWR